MKRFGILFCSILLLSSCKTQQANVGQEGLPMQRVLLVSNEAAVSVLAEIATTPEQMQKGMMFRTSLPSERGMLFVFSEERELSFWMKNTFIPLDIIFLGAQGEFVSSATMQPCRKDPCPGYTSEGPAQYALEVQAGFVNEHSIGRGWRIAVEQ